MASATAAASAVVADHVQAAGTVPSVHVDQDNSAAMGKPRYDTIGHQYATTRREDPALRDRIMNAIGDANTILNVGAGTGLYEPDDRHVIAIEPSDVMAAQRPANRVPALRLSASPLPLRDSSVDAALAVLTIHHWDDEQHDGINEMRRVARGPVVIVTFDPDVCAAWWLYRDYMREAAELDRATFPPIDVLSDWLGGTVTVEPVLTPVDTPDWTMASFWAHPERVLDEGARNSTSGFARMSDAVIDRVVASVTEDLRTGAWDRRNGALRAMSAFDAGMRLIIANP